MTYGFEGYVSFIACWLLWQHRSKKKIAPSLLADVGNYLSDAFHVSDIDALRR